MPVRPLPRRKLIAAFGTLRSLRSGLELRSPDVRRGDAVRDCCRFEPVWHAELAQDVLHVLATCPTAEASWYDGVGHAPHLEEPERFNSELAALTRRVRT